MVSSEFGVGKFVCNGIGISSASGSVTGRSIWFGRFAPGTASAEKHFFQGQRDREAQYLWLNHLFGVSRSSPWLLSFSEFPMAPLRHNDDMEASADDIGPSAVVLPILRSDTETETMPESDTETVLESDTPTVLESDTTETNDVARQGDIEMSAVAQQSHEALPHKDNVHPPPLNKKTSYLHETLDFP
jgi:hypothetical protein